MVKPKDLKRRAIYIYLPSEEIAKEWKRLAKKAEVSISKFVQEHVENSLSQEDVKKYVSRARLIRQVEELQEENRKLLEENRILKSAYEKLEGELKYYRAKPFLELQEGRREYERELIELFKKKGEVTNEEILDTLGISPRETVLVKAISKQLQNLEAYGLVEPTFNGWRWLG